jgi:hypothetical protein
MEAQTKKSQIWIGMNCLAKSDSFYLFYFIFSQIEVMGGADKEIVEMDMNKPLPIIPVLLDSDDNYMNGGEWGR